MFLGLKENKMASHDKNLKARVKSRKSRDLTSSQKVQMSRNRRASLGSQYDDKGWNKGLNLSSKK